MTSVQIPHSVAAALPTLSVFDITNEISRDVSSGGVGCAQSDSGVRPSTSRFVNPSAASFERSSSAAIVSLPVGISPVFTVSSACFSETPA